MIVKTAVMMVLAAWLTLVGQAQSYLATGETVKGKDRQTVPGFPDVLAEHLQIPGAPTPGAPAGLDKATFLRFRLARDGERPRPANVVLLAMPGFASTPSHWLFLAAQLVHRGAGETCLDGGKSAPCRIEVWVVQRRGANLADTRGALAAHRTGDTLRAAEYYFGPGILALEPERGGKWPWALAARLVGRPGALWSPFRQDDLRFMSEWGFETAAEDLDRMIELIGQRSGSRNIFLAGHSQGGSFVAAYAGRKRLDGRRGHELLSGLIFLDGGPSAGGAAALTEAQQSEYLGRVERLRQGQAPVYTDASGLLGNLSGPAAAASMLVTGVYFSLQGPLAESLFAPRGMGIPVGDRFLGAIRINNRARAGLSFDVDPLAGLGMQNPLIARLGEGLGQLDFRPAPGTESKCDPVKPAPPCLPDPAQIDPRNVYGWLEGGGGGQIRNRVGKAQLWLDSLSFAPSRSNIRPVTHRFPSSGERTIDASHLIAINWYPAERYETDLRLVGQFRRLKIEGSGVSLDIDKTTIANIPVYVARQAVTPGINNPFPGVADFTEINRQGTFQTE
ncbi:MAG: alpha/beta hydrolase, partial [Acidobacteriota bacterium]